ncbi:MAG: dTDP-4-dehydrorhamnose reductase [Bacteroidota bacterium]|nr:dTDP-4-dehydrorhamnose reductase [Bacteroidota bacterium]
MKSNFQSGENIVNTPSGPPVPVRTGAGGKILVTGANGQLGKELQEIACNYEEFEFIFLARDDMPIEQFELVRNIFKTIKPQYCINCAAYTAVDKAEEEKALAFEINGEAVGVLAAICLEHETLFIHISTDYVFDGTASLPYSETTETNPVNSYGASKLVGEEQAFLYNPETIIIRTSWLYSSFGKNFVKTILKRLKEKDEINVVNDQLGSPTYGADLAEVILQIITRLHTHPARTYPFSTGGHSPLTTHGGIYHYSNEGIINWYEFAIEIKKLSGSSCKINPITTEEYPTPAKRPAYSVLDKTKIQQTFGINLKNWKESLAICIDKIKNAIN